MKINSLLKIGFSVILSSCYIYASDLDGKTIQLESVASGSCMQPEGDNDTEGTKLIQYPCEKSSLQKFTFSKVDDDYFTISLDNGKQLSVAGKSKSNNVNIVQSSNGSEFKVNKTDMGYTFKDKNSNKYISTTAFNSDIVQKGKAKLAYQFWNEKGKYYNSCKDILDNDESKGDGVYSIYINGNETDVYCDMSTDSGGWTAFFAGKNGSSNVFGQFESGNTINSSSEYLFRIPSNIGVSNEFAASCGDAMVKFNINSEVIDFFANGVQHGWQNISNVSSIGTQSVINIPVLLWTGHPSSNSWVLSSNTGAKYNEAFSSSYFLDNWNYCNSKRDTISNIKLLYR